ncbi:MAG TPA: ABC transporter permease [Nocardioides sp.]|uniref:ABC transporter permease n=1 Tax=uncultured Nocardioides sp. TaxID=198441 RepID=UPI000EBCAF51|nr:ABC transporter permease [uncultured Nocardioides sp.]HCB03956.1 ABC transporter permease [Nocardioides sp.]HRD60569.1 ABC transporter permease [Nocardioides sp.]HRI95808.1 ABC transporter permease [Nocardioides sp.]HRK45622.1 ABC transporter permease [Nocardioides sp.]
MTATTVESLDRAPTRVAPRTPPAPIPFARLLKVELIKMFDTRAGFWLMVSIAATALIATASVIAFAPDSALTYDSFGAAIGIPMTLLLPVMAILSVTSEWTQRSGLTTFTLVPHRGRVIWAKLVVSVAIGAVSIGLALAIGALGNVVGTAIAGVPTVWDISGNQIVLLVFANVLNLLIGFMLGVLIRNSPGAIVGFVVYSFVLPTLSMVLGNFQQWWADIRPWLDFNWAQGELYDGHLTSTEWAQLGVSGLIWLVVPLAIGLVMVMRSEVK